VGKVNASSLKPRTDRKLHFGYRQIVPHLRDSFIVAKVDWHPEVSRDSICLMDILDKRPAP
jgi:hypothetical protein